MSAAVTVSVNSKEFNLLLKSIGKKAQDAVADALNKGALLVHSEAVKSVQAHLSQGETYKRGGVEHTASKAGSPPNTDTGELASNILITQTASGKDPVAVIISRAPYSMALEYGTRNMEARPFMSRALDLNSAKIVKLVRTALGESNG